MLKQAVKSTLNAVGIGIHRHKMTPSVTFLGLRTRPIKTIIDVGANEGQFGRHVSTFFPDAAIHSFEPLAEPYARLAAWAETTNGRVKSYNIAVGDKNATIDMNMHVDHSPSSSLLTSTELNEELFPFMKKQEKQEVELSTLDTALDLSDLEDDIFFKLDVQGYESRVLSGSEKLLEKVSYCMLEVNIDELFEGQASFFELCNRLNEAGLSYRGNFEQRYAPDGHVSYTDCLFIRSGK